MKHFFNKIANFIHGDQETQIKEYRERQKIKTQLKLSSIQGMYKYLSGVFDFDSIRHGKKGQGDIVIVNLRQPQTEYFTLKEYLGYFIPIDRIETIGIYTNIYLGRKFFSDVVGFIPINRQKNTLWIRIQKIFKWCGFFKKFNKLFKCTNK